MTHKPPILVALLLAVLGIGADPTSVDGITVVGADSEDNEAVAWAVDHYERAGLTLPEIEVVFHPDDTACGGADGRFRAGEDPVRIDVCTANRYIVLHELAHAWDHHNLSGDVRERFMELRGTSEWSSHEVPWSERGVEDLAQIVTWGLYECPILTDAAGKEKAFRLVTGGLPPYFQQASGCEPARTAQPDDPIDLRQDWDVVH